MKGPSDIKKNFWQFYRKIFNENMKKFGLLTEEDLEKTPLFQWKCLSWRRCYGQVIAVLKIVPKIFQSKVRIWFAQSLQTRRRLFCFKDMFLSKIFLWKQKIRFWRNFWKMPLRVRNDPPWSQKKVKNWYSFSKQKFLRFAPLEEKVHFWQGCRTVFAIKPKNVCSNPETVELLKKSLTQFFSSKRSSGT